MDRKIHTNTLDLLLDLRQDHDDGFRLLGIFLREVSSETDELFVVLQKEAIRKIYSYRHSNQEVLPKISDIYYDAFMYQNEIYDFYGKPTNNTENYILRLHLSPDDYFPKRKIGKAMITHKNPYKFTELEGDGLTEVQVGPIHAGIIPPGHFRFILDGEDTQNLDTKMGRKHRGVEAYFMQERDRAKLLEAVQEIAGDSAVAYATTFVKLLEEASDTTIGDDIILMRIILLELERIYNHLRTLGALANDVGQAMILNGFLAVREQVLNMNERIFGTRILKDTITVGGVSHVLSGADQELLHTFLASIKTRIENLSDLSTKGPGNYDRFKDTGIVLPETAYIHGALGVSARASTLPLDERLYDPRYTETAGITLDIALGEQGDSLDRFLVRANECLTSMDIIENCITKFKNTQRKSEQKSSPSSSVLKDGLYLATTEGHRGQVLLLMVVEQGEIVYFKAKDPSFVNRNLLEYAVLKNIIADFPICNKSFDLSYSGFDL